MAQWLASLSLPGLIVHDSEDEVIGFDSAEAIAAAWRTADLIKTTGLGHSGTLRDPAVIDRVIAFLTGPAQAQM